MYAIFAENAYYLWAKSACLSWRARKKFTKEVKSEEFISLRSDSSFCANRSSFHRSKWLKSG